ncbi:hypothetical protein EON65_10775 [archaeon]|nr:MAG: hypothetical protein EON65_10775 [archaeon]
MMHEVPEGRASPALKGSSSSSFQLKSLGEFIDYIWVFSTPTEPPFVLLSADFYQKIDENYRVQTTSGATCKFMMLFLLYVEAVHISLIPYII